MGRRMSFARTSRVLALLLSYAMMFQGSASIALAQTPQQSQPIEHGWSRDWQQSRYSTASSITAQRTCQDNAVRRREDTGEEQQCVAGIWYNVRLTKKLRPSERTALWIREAPLAAERQQPTRQLTTSAAYTVPQTRVPQPPTTLNPERDSLNSGLDLVAANVVRPGKRSAPPKRAEAPKRPPVEVKGSGFDLTLVAPENPNEFSAALAKQVSEIAEHAACVSEDARTEFKAELAASPRQFKFQLHVVQQWYEKYRATACVTDVTAEGDVVMVVTDPNWYKNQPAEEAWHVVDNTDLIRRSRPDTAGLYNGLLTARTPREFKETLVGMLSNPEAAHKLIDGYILRVKDPNLTEAQLQKFIEELKAGNFEVVPMASAYRSNNGRPTMKDGKLVPTIGLNFAYVPKPGQQKYWAARVKLFDGENDTQQFFVDLLQICLNVAVPVQEYRFRSTKHVLEVDVGRSNPDKNLWPILTLTKLASNSKDGEFREAVVLSAQQSVWFSFQVRNDGQTASTGNKLCDPAVPGLTPIGIGAKALQGVECVPLPDIPAHSVLGMHLVAEYSVEAFTSVTHLENTATVTNDHGQTVTARASVIYIPAQLVPPAECTSGPGCFGILGTTAPYYVQAGETLKVFLRQEAVGTTDVKLLDASIKLNENLDKKHNKLTVGVPVPMTQEHSVRDLKTNQTVRYLESGKLQPGSYTATVRFTVSGKTMECTMEIMVPKECRKCVARWVPFVAFLAGAGLGIFIGSEIFHGASAIKPIGQALGGTPRPL